MVTLLVIDDSDTSRLEFRQGMSDPDTQIIEASSALEALKLLRSKTKVNLIFCDMNMPVMDGIEFLKVKGEDPEISQVPVVMLSAMSIPEPLAQAKALGAKAWIIKPADFQKLKLFVGKYR